MRNESHGGNILAAARRYGLKPEEFLDFSASINPLGPSPKAVETLSREVSSIARYPDPECVELREELAHYLGVDGDCLVLGNGGAEIIHLGIRSLRPQRLVILAPTFSEYARAAGACGVPVARVRLCAEDRFTVDPAQVAAEMRTGDAVVICNPNNPTATLTRVETMAQLLDAATSTGATLVVDEAFMDFVTGRTAYSVLLPATLVSNLLVMGSLTKFFALPGLRVGYGVATPETINRMNRQKPPWSVNSLAQVAAVESLRDRNYIENTLAFITSERDWFAGELAKIPGVQVWPPSANFILLNVRGLGITVTPLADYLGQRGILVRDCSAFEGLDEYFIRVAVLGREANRRLLEALHRLLA